MAISIDHSTLIIFVPRADLTLISASPEVRELDVNAFRLALKDLEDDADGMTLLDTHRHVTTTTVGGVTLARVVEIINGYQVEFEDGQYAVNLVGANNNILDARIYNQVSVNPSNSAGLTDQSALAGDVEALKTKMGELWELHGLDSATPLVVTDSSRTTASVSQTITDDGATTTVTRAP